MVWTISYGALTIERFIFYGLPKFTSVNFLKFFHAKLLLYTINPEVSNIHKHAQKGLCALSKCIEMSLFCGTPVTLKTKRVDCVDFSTHIGFIKMQNDMIYLQN